MSIIYTESLELKSLAESLKTKYPNVLDYIELDKIFFAFKGGDLPDWFEYEISGLQNDWVKHLNDSFNETKMYCISFKYDVYQKCEGPLLEWTLLDLLYCCNEKMNGKLRRRDVHEFSRILNTLDDLGQSNQWRKNSHLPSLLGEETIVFCAEENESL